jgi:hypothetical protein
MRRAADHSAAPPRTRIAQLLPRPSLRCSKRTDDIGVLWAAESPESPDSAYRGAFHTVEQFEGDVAHFDVAPLRFVHQPGERLSWLAAVQRY